MLIPKLWIAIDPPTTCKGASAITSSSRRALKTGTNTTPPPVPDVFAMIAPISPTAGRNHSLPSRAGETGTSSQSAA